MTVKELINYLNNFKQDLIVSISGYEGGITDKINIRETEVHLNINDKWYYGEHEECNAYNSDDKKKEKRIVISRI